MSIPPGWQDIRSQLNVAGKSVAHGQISQANELPAGSEVLTDPLIEKVFYNLMDNSAWYGGKITTLRFSALESGDEHIIVCENDGVGVPAEEKEPIFDRGFDKNAGLGLFLSREILDITGITITGTGELGKDVWFGKDHAEFYIAHDREW